MKEKTDTPNKRITDAVHLSFELIGTKSPYPIVLKVVNAKYHILTSLRLYDSIFPYSSSFSFKNLT